MLNQNVLQASAVEFSNKRKTHCDCIAQNTIIPATSNLMLRYKRSLETLNSSTHLTTRSQTSINIFKY